jgi:MarR-like DNA-binding transcriptional regulator SgrR of sgrS sRNA
VATLLSILFVISDGFDAHVVAKLLDPPQKKVVQLEEMLTGVNLLIFRKNVPITTKPWLDVSPAEKPIGTGPYRLVSHEE